MSIPDIFGSEIFLLSWFLDMPVHAHTHSFLGCACVFLKFPFSLGLLSIFISQLLSIFKSYRFSLLKPCSLLISPIPPFYNKLFIQVSPFLKALSLLVFLSKTLFQVCNCFLYLSPIITPLFLQGNPTLFSPNLQFFLLPSKSVVFFITACSLGRQ